MSKNHRHTLDVLIEDNRWSALPFDIDAVTERAVTSVLGRAEAGLDDLILPGQDLEISAVLADDATVRTLNRDYRDKDKPTNVLSFAFLEGENFPQDASIPLLLGELILAYDTVERESAEQSKSFEAHYTHLIVHGTLHLLGFDHMEDDEAEEMESLEIAILSNLGIENPYAT